ncbi:MAG: transcription termination factor NusA [Candidatus Omnitrophica bacterium]|nr:transcription termination factor NusA [Candidatus Omnitrophota bacterium]MBU2044900.1 transcription termination factor NusA [Candidatus Omnitrophota bacterium]MBU2265891.1 transcription termination factor NusA [Candidatus Omnitrophota bacterium]MBU2473860.1 transcription termination factor NusA [Candidatus Omnitrophota bacterium]
MKKEFLTILAQLEREKGLDKQVLIDAVKHALIVAAKKIAKLSGPEDAEPEVNVEIDPLKGDIRVIVGGKEVMSNEFGRIAAQTARQVIIQKIREAEKDNIYNDYKTKEGDIVGGVVYRVEKKAMILDLMGKAEGIIPNSFLSPLDRFRLGERVKAFVYEVKKEKGVQIILSRRHEGLVRKLFNLEVPEIGEGIVEIKAIAREAGERTKVAVVSKDDKVDCVGACVGIRGSRVKSIIEELRGEKIDIVRWSEDIKEFMKAALSPAVISMIELDRTNRRAKILVAADQLSLAIGRKGQNVCLASKLVGWDIDVRSRESIEENAKALAKLKSVGKKVAAVLVDAGYSDINFLSRANPEKLSELQGIGKKKAASIIEEAKNFKPEPKQPKEKK